MKHRLILGDGTGVRPELGWEKPPENAEGPAEAGYPFFGGFYQAGEGPMPWAPFPAMPELGREAVDAKPN